MATAQSATNVGVELDDDEKPLPVSFERARSACAPFRRDLNDASMLVTREALRGELQHFAEQTLRPCIRDMVTRFTETIDQELLKKRWQKGRESNDDLQAKFKLKAHDEHIKRPGWVNINAHTQAVRDEIAEQMEELLEHREHYEAPALIDFENRKASKDTEATGHGAFLEAAFERSKLKRSSTTPTIGGQDLQSDGESVEPKNDQRHTAASSAQAKLKDMLEDYEYEKENDAVRSPPRYSMTMDADTYASVCCRAQRALLRVVETQHFETVVIIVICLNAGFICYETDWKARHLHSDTSGTWLVFEYIFLLAFVIELVMRLGAYHYQFFRWRLNDGRKNALLGWNIIDFVVVTLQVIQHIGTARGRQANGGFLSLGRLFRLARIVRLLKVFRFIRDLRMIVYSIARSFLIFVWSFVALMMMTFMFSCYFTEVVLHRRQQDPPPANDEELEHFFGSMPQTMLSLFQAITGGMDWADLTTELSNIGTILGIIPLVGYVSFSTLAMMNVITGVFLETAMERARDEKEIFLARHARGIFEKADRNKNGMITWQDFEIAIKNHKHMQNFFQAIDIDHSEAKNLFDLLDLSGDGNISAEEFLNGCLKVRGPAKSLDLLVLSREVQQLFERHFSLEAMTDLGTPANGTGEWSQGIVKDNYKRRNSTSGMAHASPNGEASHGLGFSQNSLGQHSQNSALMHVHKREKRDSVRRTKSGVSQASQDSLDENGAASPLQRLKSTASQHSSNALPGGMPYDDDEA